MKIALLSFYSGHMERGVENWAVQLKAALQPLHSVSIYQNGPITKPNQDHVAIALPVDFGKSDGRWRLARLLFVDYWSCLILQFTLKVLPRIPKDIEIIIPTNGGWQTFLVRLHTWSRGMKMVVVGHSGKGWDDRINIWCFPDAFVGLSSSACAWAKRVNPFIKVEYIPNGVDLHRFVSRGETAKVSLPKPYVLTVAALEKNKQVDLTIRAVANTPYSLQVLGTGPLESALRQLGTELLSRRFDLQKVAFEDIPNYYRGATVFTLGSWENEAFAMVCLEALASNIPVVATNDPIRKEIIGDAGILVDPKNTHAYAMALVQAVKKNWGDRPRKQAEKFSWPIVGQRYGKLFANLVSSS